MISIKNTLTQEYDIFNNIKQIPINQVLERYYGLPKKGSFFLCPFHPDKNPSLSVKGNRWRCFGCGAGPGDGVDFVAKLYNIKSIEAARMIASDFGIEINKPLTTEQKKAIKKRKAQDEITRAFKWDVNMAYDILCKVRIKICDILDSSGVYGLWCSHLPDMIDELYLEPLLNGTDQDKLSILKSGAVERWMKML